MASPDTRRFRPSTRRLRVFALDPSLAARLETATINELVLEVPWEVDGATGADLPSQGPVGEYLEVVDVDPASKARYAPIDLNDPYLLAQDGLAPSEGNPQFHQQMVYAVAMATIGHFERALGRVALWAPRVVRDENGMFLSAEFVRKLRIYPHALREANAYYSPRKKSLLFGYFPTTRDDGVNAPGSVVFTCLSHDIIAHETTHALLDGLHRRFSESTNPDVLALHEAFADIVAIFQHFSHPEVLEQQIARTRGDLAGQNMLGQLAQQFGHAVGRGGALRDAIGRVDPETGEWTRREPDPHALSRTMTPHARGAILVAAVFDAFLSMYKSRVADLLRIATSGTGVLPAGEIHPDLVRRLAGEAAGVATHVLRMCVRALDCIPPVDVTFGDFLRAIITADLHLYPEDDRGYRVAMIEAFRAHGIHPRGVRGLGEDTLVWPSGGEALADVSTPRGVAIAAPEARPRMKTSKRAPKGARPELAVAQSLRDDIRALLSLAPPRRRRRTGQKSARGSASSAAAYTGRLELEWDLETDREAVWKRMERNGEVFHDWLTKGPGRAYVEAFGLTLDENAPSSVYRDKEGRVPAVEIHSVRTALKRGGRGSLVTELVVEITQRRRGYLDPEVQRKVDSGEQALGERDRGDFRFRRGATLLIDPRNLEVRRVIRTAGDVCDNDELERVRAFLAREAPPPGNPFDADPPLPGHDDEDFARLHRLHDGEEV